MPGRSWMAALTLAAGLVPGLTTAAEPAASAEPKPAATQSVKLELQIAGLGAKGCDVAIKPGHPGCRFKTVTKHVDLTGSGWGILSVELKDVEILSADRDCTFAITIEEPGQPVRTTRRGLRVASSYEKGKLPTLSCYLNSPSRIARAEKAETVRR
jgi:hypothetical protein